MTVDRFRSSVRRISGQDRWRSVTLSLLLAVLAGALAVLAAPAAVDAFSAAPRDGGPSLSPQQELPDGPGFGAAELGPHGLEIASIRFYRGPDGDFYEKGNWISVEVGFNQDVDQSGLEDDPLTLQLELGDRQVTMNVAYEGDYVYFNYRVKRSDYDADGVVLLANSMSGTVVTDTHEVDASTLTHEALEAGDGHKVNPLVVNSLTIGPNPRNNGAYFTGSRIRIHAQFNKPVNTAPNRGNHSWIALQVGDNERLVSVNAGGEGSLYYYYTVTAEDIDEDGVSLLENPFRGDIYTNGRLVTFPDGLPHPGVSASTGHLVNPQNTIESIEITSDPGPNGFYVAGQDIEITVTFNDTIYITRIPNSALPTIRIGLDGSNRVATARIDDRAIVVPNIDTITFAYTVQDEDASVNGVMIRRNSLSAKDASILYPNNYRSVNLLHRVVSPNPDHQVNGTPGITNVEIVSEPASERGYYLLGEEVLIEVTFEAPVRLVDGADALPEISGVLHDGLDFELGPGPQFSRRSFLYREGSGSETWIFAMAVEPGDSAYLGISTAANMTWWGPDLVETLYDGAVDASFDPIPLSRDHRIYAGPVATDVTVTSTPEVESGYRSGEIFTFAITYDLPVSVEVAMQIDLQIGDQVRQANLQFRPYPGNLSTPTLSYWYRFQESDADADGIEILDTPSRDAIDFTNGYVFMSYEYDYNGTWEFINPVPGALTDHKVVDAPRELVLVALAISSEADDRRAYSTGETIELQATFNLSVTLDSSVDQDAGVTILIGDSERIAPLRESDDGVLFFEYSVTEDDIDEDGIAIAENPFSGAITTLDGTTELAEITHSGISSDSDHRVNPQPDIRRISIASGPGGRGAYFAGGEIVVRIDFKQNVHVEGEGTTKPPTIDLVLDGNARSATYTGEAEVKRDEEIAGLLFSYTVDELDSSLDGVAIRANSLAFHGSPIKVTATDRTVSRLHRGVAADPSQIVRGRPIITSVEFASLPEYERGYYRRDDEILIQVTFEVPVQLVDGADGLPELLVKYEDPWGNVYYESQDRSFVYHSGSGTDTWLFSRTVGQFGSAYFGMLIKSIGPEHNWADGLVETLSGGAVNATFADGELAPEQQLYAGPQATGVTVTSSPEDESGYRAGETFTFDITFGVAMAPETPMDIYLQVGANVRSATLIEGHSSAAARTFSYDYTFTDSDSDPDGIEILHTPNWDEDGELFNGYMHQSGGRTHIPYLSVPMREFVNPSPGVLSDHKVVGSEPQEEGSEHLSWLPTEE